jgi:beta-fructofuranosidase
MNWPGGTLLAPETLLDNKERRIFWSWVLDRKSGISSGTMSMPRILTLSKDKQSLHITPPKEIENLRYNEVQKEPFIVSSNQEVNLSNIAGKSMEIDITIDPDEAKRFGIKVFCSENGEEQTPIIIDREKSVIEIDLKYSSLKKTDYYKYLFAFAAPDENNPLVDKQEAPFKLGRKEKVHLRIFLDKSVLEVFVNDRLCMTQVVYPTLKDAVNVQVFTDDAPIKVESVKAWSLFPAMQW